MSREYQASYSSVLYVWHTVSTVRIFYDPKAPYEATSQPGIPRNVFLLSAGGKRKRSLPLFRTSPVYGGDTEVIDGSSSLVAAEAPLGRTVLQRRPFRKRRSREGSKQYQQDVVY